MDIIFGLIFGLGIPALIVAGIVFLILRLKAGGSLKISYRALLRFYFYVVILVSVGLLTVGGASTLLKVGFGEIFGHDFSYGQVYQEYEWLERDRAQALEDGNEPAYLFADARTLPEKIDLAVKTSLINGLSLTAIGLFLFTLHFFGRRWVETEEERSDLLRKIYLISGLVFFAIITVVTLSQGLPEALRYTMLDLRVGEVSPGEPLSVGIIVLPVWMVYLVATIRTIRTGNQES